MKAKKKSKKESAFDRKAERSRKIVGELTDSLYNLHDRDAQLRYENLKTYRTELMRGFIVYMHLAIEDLLKAILFDFLVKQNRSLPTKTTKCIVDDLKSSDIMHWCGRLKLIRSKKYSQLLELRLN
jgi:hypothetical protein